MVFAVTDPPHFWAAVWRWISESETRSGINEMKHIEGLYAFLDYLLVHKPELVIDNCAGGESP